MAIVWREKYKRGVCRQWEATILWLETESKETGWWLKEVP